MKKPKKPVDRRVARLGAAELERLAEISPADIEDARDAWRKDAPAQFRGLLDAKPTDTER